MKDGASFFQVWGKVYTTSAKRRDHLLLGSFDDIAAATKFIAEYSENMVEGEELTVKMV